MVRDGRIVDAKSIATILYADRFLRGGRDGHGPGGAGGCVPLLRSGVPKVGRMGAAEPAGIGYFGICRSGTVRAMPVRRDG